MRVLKTQSHQKLPPKRLRWGTPCSSNADILNEDGCSDVVHRTSTGFDLKMETHENEKGWWQRGQSFDCGRDLISRRNGYIWTFQCDAPLHRHPRLHRRPWSSFKSL